MQFKILVLIVASAVIGATLVSAMKATKSPWDCMNVGKLQCSYCCSQAGYLRGDHSISDRLCYCINSLTSGRTIDKLDPDLGYERIHFNRFL